VRHSSGHPDAGDVTMMAAPSSASFRSTVENVAGSVVWSAVTQSTRSTSARLLPRQPHFSARARMTVRFRLVATPRYFSTAALVSVASW
jgi:hypothetical protein